MPSLIPVNSTSPLHVLLPQLLCFTIHHENGGSDWIQEVQSIEKVAQLQDLVSKLEKDLVKSRKKNKELVDRNEQMQNQIVSATTRNHELQDNMVQLHHNLTLRNHQLGDDVVLVQRNLSIRSVDLVCRLLRIEKEHDACQLALQTTNDALSDVKEHINSSHVAVEMAGEKVLQLTEQINKAKTQVRSNTGTNAALIDCQVQLDNVTKQVTTCHKNLTIVQSHVRDTSNNLNNLQKDLNIRTNHLENVKKQVHIFAQNFQDIHIKLRNRTQELNLCNNELQLAQAQVQRNAGTGQALKDCQNEVNNIKNAETMCKTDLKNKEEQLKNVTVEATACKNILANTQVLNEAELASRLLEASDAGRIDEVKALLKLNASLKSTNELGYTPLLCAAATAHLGIVEELFKAGATVTDLSRKNETVLHLVLARKDNEWDPEQDNLAQLFINEGANISAKTNAGDTPLHVAVQYNRHKMVKVLLDAGQDVSVINKVNNTPLHEAVKYNALESICLLMKKGANPKAVNKQNKTPLDFTEGKPDVKDYIINHYNYLC